MPIEHNMFRRFKKIFWSINIFILLQTSFLRKKDLYE